MVKLKIAVVHNKTEHSLQITAELLEKLMAAGHTIDQTNPELVISVGGDGTLLSAFHLYSHKLDQVRFIGVHTGHLGFYTDWRDYEVDDLIELLSTKKEESVHYPLLDVRITYRNGKPAKHFLSLNESTVKRTDTTMVADIYIRDELFERFRGDGLSVSTPTGSTAYNKSIGGAVLHPRINAIQLAEIASLNNRVFRTLGSPMVIASHEWIELRMQDSAECLITIDQFQLQQEEIKSIFYRIADEKIQFASYRHTHFWRRVRDAFIGDLDE